MTNVKKTCFQMLLKYHNAGCVLNVIQECVPECRCCCVHLPSFIVLFLFGLAGAIFDSLLGGTSSIVHINIQVHHISTFLITIRLSPPSIILTMTSVGNARPVHYSQPVMRD